MAESKKKEASKKAEEKVVAKAEKKVPMTNEELVAKVKASGDKILFGGEECEIHEVRGLDIVLRRKDYR